MTENAHVFVVDIDSYPIHRDRLFCGIKNPPKFNKKGRYNTSYFGLYADVLSVRKGDVVFFYQMRKEEEKLSRGFRGIFRVVSEPFFDDSDIEGTEGSVGEEGSYGKSVFGKCPYCQTSISDKTENKKIQIKTKKGKIRTKNIRVYVCQVCKKEIQSHILPIRVLIEPIDYFDVPVDDNTAYIDRNFIRKKGMLWTMLFRKVYGAGRERSITHILPEESEKLKFLFSRLTTKNLQTKKEYPLSKNIHPLEIELKTDESGELLVEGMLEAWIMKNMGNNIIGLSEILGNPKNFEYFGNNVLYGIGGEKVDILIIHDSDKTRTKATVIELKKGEITKKDVQQIKEYTKWMAQLVFGKDSKKAKQAIQLILIGHGVPEKIIELADKSIKDTQKPIILRYKVEKKNITFEKVFY